MGKWYKKVLWEFYCLGKIHETDGLMQESIGSRQKNFTTHTNHEIDKFVNSRENEQMTLGMAN